MKRLALLAIPLVIAGCTQAQLGSSPALQPQPAAQIREVRPQPSAEVRDAQQQLRTIGLYGGPLDGLYGSETRSAVDRFQRNQGLAVTARLDDRTLGALRREAARSAEPVALSDPTHVRTIQNRLRQLGFYDGAADGVWGPEIQRALERFQRGRGLAVGHVTRPTLVAMDLDPDVFPRSTTARADTRADKGEPLEPVVVRGIQQRLRELGFYPGAVDGLWGPGTQAALEGFQRSRGLADVGTLNPMTASALGLDPNDLSESAASIRGGPRARR